ncbi:MmcQ/YjbR family DNA-binding protein [Cohnella cellulosilytica]|uniref:MmcQ/YjbR family DNA-binding protein n=1 Tax=Cohnella cellulosilytica TaxID=986710 RepID=A0ABW2F8D7_9BACL
MVTTDELRRLALELPEAEEQMHWDKPSYRVRGKIFAVEQPDGVTALLKMSLEEREAQVTLAPDIFGIPEKYATLAYVFVRLDRIERDELRSLLVGAWKQVAPKSLLKRLPDDIPGTPS